MGRLRRAVGSTKKRSGPAVGQWEWEFERSTSTSAFSDAELTELLKSAVEIQLKREHLLSERNMRQLRRALSADENTWPNSRLHRHVDELAVNVGLHRKAERQIPPAKRVELIERHFIAPAELLAKAINDHELSKEFSQPWGGFVGFEAKSFQLSLAKFISAGRKHVKQIKKTSNKGKVWDSDLKERFVELVSMLCEYVNPTFEPKRKNIDKREENSTFRDVVRMLGQPIFGDVDFDGAIRKLVDRWNANKKLMTKQIVRSKSVAEKSSK